jgi:hypothetical protein
VEEFTTPDQARQLCIEMSRCFFGNARRNLFPEGFVLLDAGSTKTDQMVLPLYQGINNVYYTGWNTIYPVFRTTSYSYRIGSKDLSGLQSRINWAYSKGGGLSSPTWDSSRWGEVKREGMFIMDHSFCQMQRDFREKPGEFLKGMYAPIVEDGRATVEPLTPHSPAGQQYLNEDPLAPFPGIDVNLQEQIPILILARWLYWITNKNAIKEAEEGILAINELARGIERAGGIKLPIVPGDDWRLQELDRIYKKWAARRKENNSG